MRCPRSGIFVTAIAARTNALIEFWIIGFRLLGREIPYNTSEDVETALQELGADYQKQQVAYELTFPDTEENRMRIIRFLLADHLAQMPHRPLLGFVRSIQPRRPDSHPNCERPFYGSGDEIRLGATS